ncbi:UDP-glucuronate 4-epimerase [Cyclonatronum proteinivorum]|uniref:UDP-glucuronate 4-epimerase n=1 Tax=Cyclonatronum proteinivorum TaxID=1457365 RepID=A0A345UIW9_9BACT|nr:NAD-dependent epimerase [Cyclonatronum proteinivorum]AXJ00421.1 UDP-glucuronate 4-epimerase [Cyclonatronum proteinivorum]
MKVMITGTAGFIGFHLVKLLIQDGHEVVGIDSINDYYDINLKYDRLKETGIDKEAIQEGTAVQSTTLSGYRFVKLGLEDKEGILELFKKERFDVVVNLAAQAGVRYSLINPHTYIDANITGFLNILEGCRHYPVKHLIYASSSSVYGANTKMPFSVNHNVDHPVSLYATSKKANELMAHTYANLFNIPSTGLRFFTVYGPWGRPDMALFLFTKAITENKPIDVFNHGEMMRDFTYIDDIVESIRRLVPKPPVASTSWSGDNPDPATSFAPYQIFNIGNSNPVKLMDFVKEIEKNLGREAEKNMMDIQPGDVPKTWADVEALFDYTDYRPKYTIKEGIKNFIEWYKDYYKVSV